MGGEGKSDNKDCLKTIGWSHQTLRPSLGQLNSLTEGFLQSMCLSVRAAFWNQDVGVKMSFDNPKPMKINLRQNLKRTFYWAAIKGSLYKMFYLSTIYWKSKRYIFFNLCVAIEARTSMVVLAVSFSKPVWGQFNLQVKTAI